jgi:hypothetical protein
MSHAPLALVWTLAAFLRLVFEKLSVFPRARPLTNHKSAASDGGLGEDDTSRCALAAMGVRPPGHR